MVDRTRKLVRVYTDTNVDIKYNTLKNALDEIQGLIARYGEDAEIEDRKSTRLNSSHT